MVILDFEGRSIINLFNWLQMFFFFLLYLASLFFSIFLLKQTSQFLLYFSSISIHFISLFSMFIYSISHPFFSFLPKAPASFYSMTSLVATEQISQYKIDFKRANGLAMKYRRWSMKAGRVRNSFAFVKGPFHAKSSFCLVWRVSHPMSFYR